jgi:hypothetical protein
VVSFLYVMFEQSDSTIEVLAFDGRENSRWRSSSDTGRLARRVDHPGATRAVGYGPTLPMPVFGRSGHGLMIALGPRDS